MILNIELSNKHMREVRELTLTSESLEDTVEMYPYSGENRVKDELVERTQLPPIALAFYSFLYEFNTVPTPEVLIEDYLAQDYFSEVSQNEYAVSYGTTNTVISKEGLIARILRTYPSLLRDLHFYLMAVESELFEGVWYSLDDDFKKGIDIKVRYNGKWYKIALLQNTRRSVFYRNKKRGCHPLVIKPCSDNPSLICKCIIA